MASTIESIQTLNAHEEHPTTFGRPMPIRTTSIPLVSSVGQSPWTGLNDIWTKSGGHQGGRHDIGIRNATCEKSENAVESELTVRPVSPSHHDRLSRLRISTANGAPAHREQRSLAVTNNASRNLPSLSLAATSSTTRAVAAHVSPPRFRQQGLPVSVAGQSMSILSNAGLLSGSAPDVEVMSGNSSYPHHHGHNAFRTLNIDGVNEFVPSGQLSAMESRPLENGSTHDSALSGPIYSNDQNLGSARFRDFRVFDYGQGRFAGDFGYPSGMSRGASEVNNRALNSFGDAYDFESHQTTNIQNGNFPTPHLSGEYVDTAPSQRHVDTRGRVGVVFASDKTNEFKMFNPTWNGSLSNSQAYEQQYHSHMNRTAFMFNKETPAYMNHDIRHGMYTPAFTPPSAPESQRSASGSGPSTGASSLAIDPKARGHENNQTRPQGRMATYPAYTSQVSHTYSNGYQQNGGYSDAYAANRMVNAMGPTSQEMCDQNEDPEKPISPFLKDFKVNCKTKRYELKDVYGYIVEFSGDQHGSRFIQGKLETANSDEKEQVFAEIQENALQLMTDIFGNYVIQKLFEHGTQAQKKVLANQMKGRVLYLTTQVYGCRVVQKALEHVLTDQQASMVRELEGHILPIVENQNGNHVIQKAIERVPGEQTHFVTDALKGQIVRLAKHNYGCRVVQRILEYGQVSVKRSILAELHMSVSSLIADTFGNYVVQHIIRHGEPADRARVVALVQQQLLFYSKHKFASNVVEAAIESAEEDQRQEILRGLTGPDHEGHTPVYNLIRDQYGNYVIQKVLQRLTGPAKDDLIRELRYSLVALRRVSNGKQVSAIEKAIAEATSGYSQPSPPRASHHGSHTTHHVPPPDYYHSRNQYHGQLASHPFVLTNGVRS